METTKTETGIEITFGKFAVRIDQNDHEGKDFIATLGRYDTRGEFCCSACFASRSYKSMARATKEAKALLVRAVLSASSASRTLLADDGILVESR